MTAVDARATEPRPVTDPVPGVWTEVADAAAIAAQPGAAEPGAFALAVKANIGVAGFRRSAACRVLDVAPESDDAPVVAAFRAAGAVVVGITNMHELAFGITSDNASYGPVLVPGHPDRSAGGSSGGSAAAVASGAVPMALGTDTGGSVSIPASLNGVVGFRPSTGRWPTAGLVGLSWTRDTPGVFATSVAEAVRADGWVTGSRAAEPPARPRLGVPRELVAGLAPETEQAFAAACAALGGGAELVEVDLGPVLECTHRAEMPIVLHETHRLLAEVGAVAFGVAPDEAFERIARGAASPDVAAILAAELEHPVSAEAYAAAQADVLEARRRYDALFDEHGLDALVLPATPAPAPPAGENDTVEHLGERVSTFGLYTRNTGPGTVLGAPTVTMPLPVAEGALPVGLAVQGRRLADPELLGLAVELERRIAAGG